jgi:hypothetical protein
MRLGVFHVKHQETRAVSGRVQFADISRDE